MIRELAACCWLVFYFVGLAPLKGQDDVDRASKQADAELTAAYKGCLAQFPPNLKEQLRIAERAWIAFSDKDEAAAAFAGERRGLSEDDLGRESLNEVNARARELRSFFFLPNEDLQSCRQEWQQADAQLTAAYQALMRSLAPDEQKKVREAERSWIDYRDKDSRSHVGDPSGRAPVWAAVVVTRRRVEQLQGFYGKLVSLPLVASTPPPTPAATPTPLDPATRAKLIADYHAKAEQMSQKLVNQPWSKTPIAALSQVPTLPSELATAIQTTASDARETRRELGDDAKTLKELEDETCLVDGAAAFSEACEDVHSGNAVRAGEAVDTFRQAYASAPGEKSKAIWQTMDALHTLFAKLHEEANAHVSKAASLSDAGKAGNAIEEYQRAFDLFPDPEIANRIKTLREQSLGL